LCLKALQNDLSQLREFQAADPRTFRSERRHLFEVSPIRLSFATTRAELVTYAFEPTAWSLTRTVAPLDERELSVRELIMKKVRERVEKTFAAVTDEVRAQVQEKVNELQEAFTLGDPRQALEDPVALTQRCTVVFDKLQYYTGTGNGEPPFVADLKTLVTTRAQKMAADIGYGIEADAEEIMGTVLTRLFQLEELAPPRLNRVTTSSRTFRLKGSYRLVFADGTEPAPSSAALSDGRLRGFRFFLESTNPVSALEVFYQKQGVLIAPNALAQESTATLAHWNQNPNPRVKLKVMDLITTQELTGRYFGEAIIPDANILYKTWVEIPEFWFLDIFNTEAEVDKLRKGLINPDDAEPKQL
ncbi:MAG TPA: hypothetical protein PKO06_21675, partial [Candidatus Ozemobacteraceae bacterium]|nr:hypothetical protein [Candidatus Ozemobacteraceae bacterium]